MASDTELIARSVAGDDEAFVELMRRHEAVVWTYVARRVGRGVAEDLMSEVWVAAFGARASYDRAFPDARPWLFGIALNVLRGHWRSRPDEDLEPDMADLVKGSPGDATLLIRDQSYPDRPSISGTDLYTDRGEYFYAPTESGLPAQIAAGDNQGNGMFAQVIAAAISAVSGDLATARQQMAAAPLPPGGSLPADISQPIASGPTSTAKGGGESGVIRPNNTLRVRVFRSATG